MHWKKKSATLREKNFNEKKFSQKKISQANIIANLALIRENFFHKINQKYPLAKINSKKIDVFLKNILEPESVLLKREVI